MSVTKVELRVTRTCANCGFTHTNTSLLNDYVDFKPGLYERASERIGNSVISAVHPWPHNLCGVCTTQADNASLHALAQRKGKFA